MNVTTLQQRRAWAAEHLNADPAPDTARIPLAVHGPPTLLNALDAAADAALEAASVLPPEHRPARAWQRLMADPRFNSAHSNVIAERIAAAAITRR